MQLINQTKNIEIILLPLEEFITFILHTDGHFLKNFHCI